MAFDTTSEFILCFFLLRPFLVLSTVGKFPLAPCPVDSTRFDGVAAGSGNSDSELLLDEAAWDSRPVSGSGFGMFEIPGNLI